MIELTSEEQRWLNGLREFDAGNRLAFLAICAGFGMPPSYLDIGCGSGAMVKLARALCIDAHGVDILPHDETFFTKHDLNVSLDLNRQFALVTSIEVVEHICEKSEGALCDTLVRHVAPEGRLVLTSAPPGQVGDGHINCQAKKYWRDRMISRGLKYSEPDTRRLYVLWSHTLWASHWCEENLQVFKR